MLHYKESRLFFTQEEIITIERDILKNTFPWYLHPNPTTTKFFFMSHSLIKRHEKKINSGVFPFFENIFKRFLKDHNLKCKEILRGSLNLTFADKRFAYSDPHVDWPLSHKVCIMYLNTTTGDTIIFDKKYQKNTQVYPVEEKPHFKILKTISPEPGKIICFNGQYYHANSFCEEGKHRIILILNFK